MDFGRRKNIFSTINNGGRDGKGMISWKGTLKPKRNAKR
jgi:cytochrome c oxidase cbb3-type subunit 3